MEQALTKKYALVAMLSVIAYFLMLFSVAIIPFVAWMKLDLSDVIVLLALFCLGVKGGIEVAAFKSLLYFLVSGPDLTNLIGTLTSFIAILAFCLPIYFYLKPAPKNWKSYTIAITLGTVSLTVLLALLNWLVITPLYIRLLGLHLQISLPILILGGVIPFNLIKGVVVGTVFVVIFNRLKNWSQCQ